MNVNVRSLVSMTDANRHFSEVARLADEHGSAVILRNNKPAYAVIAFETLEEVEQEGGEGEVANDGSSTAPTSEKQKNPAFREVSCGSEGHRSPDLSIFSPKGTLEAPELDPVDQPGSREISGVEALARSAKACAHPVQTPEGPVRCGTRYMSKCVSCARIVQQDWRAIIRSGWDPALVSEDTLQLHDFAFLTLTAPSFGKIRSGQGVPVDPDDYDYLQQTAWNYGSGALLSRTLETLGRKIGATYRVLVPAKNWCPLPLWVGCASRPVGVSFDVVASLVTLTPVVS